MFICLFPFLAVTIYMQSSGFSVPFLLLYVHVVLQCVCVEFCQLFSVAVSRCSLPHNSQFIIIKRLLCCILWCLHACDSKRGLSPSCSQSSGRGVGLSSPAPLFFALDCNLLFLDHIILSSVVIT